jgi:molecular chaperone DnaK (HSP70)
MHGLISLLAKSIRFLGFRFTRRLSVVVEDCTPIVGANGMTIEALGIGTVAGEFIPVIEAGTTVPCSFAENFTTAIDGQDKIMVSLYRGTEERVENNHSLGIFQVVGIPDVARETPLIEIIFTVTDQQILLSAHELDSNAEMEIEAMHESGEK